MDDGRVGLQIESFGESGSWKMHDEIVRSETSGSDAGASFSAFDAEDPVCKVCWGELYVVNGGEVFLYRALEPIFGLFWRRLRS